MRKVLTIFDGQHFSKAAFDFASKLNETQTILLTGVFLPSIDYTKLIYLLGGVEGYVNTAIEVESEASVIEENIETFKSLCIKHNIEHRIHNKINGPILEELHKETRYSDLLVLSSDLFYSNFSKRSQKKQLQDTLRLSECPVVVLPESYDFPESIILAFDGSESSVFAIKQFAYVLPELTSLDTIVVYVSEKDAEIPHFDYMKEFAARHFSNLSFFRLRTDPRDYFSTWLTDVRAPLLVSGSYGRSALSEFFNNSFIEDVINDHKLPVFVAHT